MIKGRHTKVIGLLLVMAMMLSFVVGCGGSDTDSKAK